MRLRLIGDVVLTTPLLRALKRTYPDAQLTYLVEPAAAPVVAAIPASRVSSSSPKRPRGSRVRTTCAMARRLSPRTIRRRDRSARRARGPHGSRWASGAPMRIGTPSRAARGCAPTSSIGLETRRHARRSSTSGTCLRRSTSAAPDPARDPLEMVEDAQAAASVERRLREAAASRPRTRSSSCTSARATRFAAGLRESFEALVIALARRDPSRRIILTSGPSDASATKAIADGARRALRASAAAVPEMGEFDLAELRALVGRAAVYVVATAGPFTSPARRRRRLSRCLDRRSPSDRCRGATPQWFAEAVDAGPLECRPCRQRECAPGDFRCLTQHHGRTGGRGRRTSHLGKHYDYGDDEHDAPTDTRRVSSALTVCAAALLSSRRCRSRSPPREHPRSR